MFQDTSAVYNSTESSNIPVVKMELLDFAKQISGRSDIESISFLDPYTKEIRSTVNFYGHGDSMPSVLFSIEELFDIKITDNGFPGVI